MEVRLAAAYALGRLRQKEALSSLLSSVLNISEAAKVRGMAAEALGYIGDQTAVPDLIEVLSDESPEVRYWAAFALGELKDRRALHALREVAVRDTARVEGLGSVRLEAERSEASILGLEE